MTIEAIALLKLTTQQIDAAFPAKGSARPGADGSPLKLSALEDSVLLILGVSFDLEPDEAGYEVRKRLGALLDSHDDARGIFIIPDRAKPRARTYAEALEEVGDLGFWAIKVRADYAPVERSTEPDLDEVSSRQTLVDNNTLGAQLQSLMGSINPDMMAQAQSMLSGPGGSDIFAAAQQQLSQMMSQPGGFDALAKGLSEALGAQGIDPTDLKALMPEKMPTPEEMQALFEKGQAEFEQMQREDPNKAKELHDKFGDLLSPKKK
jgi:hypothetical protein